MRDSRKIKNCKFTKFNLDCFSSDAIFCCMDFSTRRTLAKLDENYLGLHLNPKLSSKMSVQR